jgi:hypothetical protein
MLCLSLDAPAVTLTLVPVVPRPRASDLKPVPEPEFVTLKPVTVCWFDVFLSRGGMLVLYLNAKTSAGSRLQHMQSRAGPLLYYSHAGYR